MDDYEKSKELLLDIKKTNQEILEQIDRLNESRSRRKTETKNASPDSDADTVDPQTGLATSTKSGDSDTQVENQDTDKMTTPSNSTDDRQTESSMTERSQKRPKNQYGFKLTSEMMSYSEKLRRQRTRPDEDNRVRVRFSVKHSKEMLERESEKDVEEVEPQSVENELERSTESEEESVPDQLAGMQPFIRQMQDAWKGLLGTSGGITVADILEGLTFAINLQTGSQMFIKKADIQDVVSQAGITQTPLLVVTTDMQDMSLKVVSGHEHLDVICSGYQDALEDSGTSEEMKSIVLSYGDFFRGLRDDGKASIMKWFQFFSNNGLQPMLESQMSLFSSMFGEQMMENNESRSREVTASIKLPRRALSGKEPREVTFGNHQTREVMPKPETTVQSATVRQQVSQPQCTVSGKNQTGNSNLKVHASPNVPSSQSKHTASTREQAVVRPPSQEQHGQQASADTRSSPSLQLKPPTANSQTPTRDAASEAEADMVIDNDEMWYSLAQQEITKGAPARNVRERGMDTIFCLDMSGSMEGEPWKQATDFIRGFIEGIQNSTLRDGIYEHVGLVTFGSTNRVQQHMTCDYIEVLRKLSAVFSCHGYKIYPRVFIISDGRPTPAGLVATSDNHVSSNPLLDKIKIIDVLKKLHKEVPVTVNVVPVGDGDMDFLGQLANMTGGKVIMPHDWASQTRTFNNYTVAAQFGHILSADPNLANLVLGMCSDHDKLEMVEFLKKHEKESDDDSDGEDIPGYPPLGSRVMRNIAVYAAGNPDLGGTITRHFSDGHVGVTWDDATHGDGENTREKVVFTDSKKGVIPCDKPRILKDELIAPGCRVKRGKDWRYPDQDGGAGKLGSVFSVDQQGIIKVRWDIGTKNTYRYGQDGIYFDVEIVTVEQRQPEQSKNSYIIGTSAAPAIDPIEEMNKKNLAHCGAPVTAGAEGVDRSISDAIDKPHLDQHSPEDNGDDKGQRTIKNAENQPALHRSTKTDQSKTDVKEDVPKGETSNGARPKAVAEPEKVQWSWKKDGVWHPYPGDLCGKIENQPALHRSTKTDQSKTDVKEDVPKGETSNGARPKAVAEPEKVQWSWKKDGVWHPYPGDLCGKIETSFRRNCRGTALVQLEGKQFRIVFSRMEQVQTDTKEKFPVHRK